MTYDDERDTTIADALDQVTVPDHAPGFWAELDDRLAAEAPVVPMRRLGRYSRFPRLLAVAAAVVVLAAATAVLLALDDDPQSVRVAEDPTTSTTPDPTATVPESTTTTAKATTTTTAKPGTTSSKVGAAAPDTAAINWIKALGDGDIDKAAGLTGPLSEAYITSQGGNLRGYLTEAQEGWGGWASSPDRSTTEVDIRSGDGIERTVVVVMGTNNGEGSDGNYRTDAVPVAKVGRNGTWLVEPTAFDPEVGGRIEMIRPSAGESGLNGLAADSTIEASAPGRGEFSFSLDDSPAVRGNARNVDGPGVRAVWDPPGDMKSQSHLLVVAYVDDHIFTAFAGIFAVEG